MANQELESAADQDAKPRSPQIYINGELFDKENAKVSVFDHGLLYGDGVFEGMRSYGGRIFRLDEHLQRLWESAKAIWLEIPMTPEAIAAAVRDTLRVNSIQDGYVRLVVTRGTGTLGLDPNKCSDPQVIIIADHITLYPDEFYEFGLEIVTVSTSRNHPAALSPRIKSLNYLNNILAKIEGLQAGCVEALMLNHRGEVAECTGDNIFLVAGGELLVVEAETVEDGGLQGVDVDGGTGDVVAQLGGFADDLAGLYAAAGEPHAEGEGMMVAAFLAGCVAAAHFVHRRAAKLTAPHDERFVE